tara:strand:+ start:351 stop:548 length:198 start_codon:yes stop_codon:yes gene_type:complete
MDGLLIDSEEKYTIATNAVLNKYGKPNIPWSMYMSQSQYGRNFTKCIQKSKNARTSWPSSGGCPP